MQEELSAGLWLGEECLLLHSVLVCLDKKEKLLRSLGLEEEPDKFSSFSFEVHKTRIIVQCIMNCQYTIPHLHSLATVTFDWLYCGSLQNSDDRTGGLGD